MPFDTIRPYSSFADGQRNRLQRDYGESRNALAQMEVQNAPEETRQRNELFRMQQQRFSEEEIKQALHKTASAASRLAQSKNPKGEAGVYPGFIGKLREQGVDIDAMGDDDARQYFEWVAGQAQSELGLAPAGPVSTQGKVGADVKAGYLTQEQANQALNPGMTPYQSERLKIERQRLAQGGNAPSVATMTPDEVQAAGLPTGTVAQRNAQGKINILKKPDAAGGGVKLTEGDKRARVTYASILNAENDISKMAGDDTSSGYNAVVGSNPLTRGMQTDDYRKYEAAGLRWAANLLYLKSGATATPDEIRSTWKQFFPQFGDGDDVKEQKHASRLQEIEAVADAFGLDKSKIPKKPAPQSAQPPQQTSAPSAAEMTATGPNGQKLVLRGGKWVPL